MAGFNPVAAHRDAGIPVSDQSWTDCSADGDDLASVVFERCTFSRVRFERTRFIGQCPSIADSTPLDRDDPLRCEPITAFPVYQYVISKQSYGRLEVSDECDTNRLHAVHFATRHLSAPSSEQVHVSRG